MRTLDLLNIYIEEHKNKPFVWGSNDCCTFASNWVERLKGVNPLEELGHYGTYFTEEEAILLLKKLGGVIRIVNKSLGIASGPALAHPGDLVCGDMGYGNTLGICLGSECVFLGQDDLITGRTLEMKKAWRI